MQSFLDFKGVLSFSQQFEYFGMHYRLSQMIGTMEHQVHLEVIGQHLLVQLAVGFQKHLGFTEELEHHYCYLVL